MGLFYVKHNILITFLDLLKVKYTRGFSSQFYEEYPYNKTLFGLSKMLSEYGVENKGLKVYDKAELITTLAPPYIAHYKDDFVIVCNSVSDKITYIQNNREKTIPVDEFKEEWDGILLVADPDKDAIEPEYKKHKLEFLFQNFAKYALLFSLIGLIFSLFIYNSLYTNMGLILLLGLNLTGSFTGYLLVLKQMNIESDTAEKICSLFKQADCNDVLNSSASRFMGVIGWAEIGFCYFVSSVIILLLAPQWVTCFMIVNSCALPYTFWSVWYQKVKAKQWCALCLIVQLLLWSSFGVGVLSGFIVFSQLSIVGFLFVGLVYIMVFGCIHLLLPFIIRSYKISPLTRRWNAFRMRDEIFTAALQSKPKNEVSRDTSKIVFGNTRFDTVVTIFTNPHCEPCAQMHKQVEELLKKSEGEISVQYVYTCFGFEYEVSSRFLIAVYLNNKPDEALKIYHRWFEYDKYFKEACFSRYNYDLYTERVNKEWANHRAWKLKYDLHMTPTVFVNGYELDRNYKIGDLLFLLHTNTLKL